MNNPAFPAFSKTGFRILQFFFDEPAEGIHLRELSRRAKISAGSASSHLRKLLQAGFLASKVQGKNKIYELKRGNAFVRHTGVQIILLQLARLVRALESCSERAVLFGSCARGDYDCKSDIDLLVISSDKRGANGVLAKFSEKSSRKISAIVMSPLEFQKLKVSDKPLYSRIMEGITLFSKIDAP